MSNWSGFTLTNMGADLQAKINAGVTTLALTKIGLGSGSGSGSINALTQMFNKVQDVQISKITPNNNIVEVDFTLTNKGLNAAYKMSEMGIFATDPDEGEILFAYMTDSSPDTMPADGSATVVSLDVTLNITFSNTGNVSATIDTGAFVTHDDLTTAFAAHNESEQAHDNRFNAIIRQFNNMITPTDDSDKQSLAPTLALVKTLLSTLDIKNSTDVINALDTETLASLGVSYSLINIDAWYICFGKLFGGLIIQGGTVVSGGGVFPIRFNKAFTVVGTLFDSSNNSVNNYDDAVIYDNSGVWFRFYAHKYIAVGI